jgi:hypothetical protein
VLLPALYLPLILMLLGLIFRGVAFEFRFTAWSCIRAWRRAGGSTDGQLQPRLSCRSCRSRFSARRVC